MRRIPGRPLLRFLALYGALYAGFGVQSPFFPLFLSARGLDAEAIGVVLAAGTTARLIAGPLGGSLADRFDATRLVLAASAAAAALVGLGFLTASGFWPLFILGLCVATALAPIAPLADTLALASAHRRGSGGHAAFPYGWVRGAGSAAFILGSLLSGQAIPRFGLAAIIALNATLIALAALCAVAVPDDVRRQREAADAAEAVAEPGRAARPGIGALLALARYRRLVLVSALVFGSHAMHDAFAVIRWRAAGIGPDTVSVLWSLSVAAEVVVFFLLGRPLIDRLGPAGAAALAAAAGVLRWVVMAETVWIPALVLIQPLHGLTFALLHLACMQILVEIVPAGLAARAQTLYGTVGAGLASVILTLASGPLYARFGAAGFFAMAVLCAIAAPLAVTLRSAPPR